MQRIVCKTNGINRKLLHYAAEFSFVGVLECVCLCAADATASAMVKENSHWIFFRFHRLIKIMFYVRSMCAQNLQST